MPTGADKYWEKREAKYDESWAKKKEELKQQGIVHIMGSYVDIHGRPKAKVVPIDKFESMMKGSELFTLAALEGLGQDVADDECSVRPDLDAITPIPWIESLAWAPGSLYFHGDPWPLDSRNVLKRQRARAAEKGWYLLMGIEPEHYLVRFEDGRMVPFYPNDKIGKVAYDVPLFMDAFPYVQQMYNYMKQLGWAPSSYDHEDGNSQFEIDWAPADCLKLSDQFVLFKMMAKHVASTLGAQATFLAKPFADRTGTGAHFNLSLGEIETRKNIFDDPSHQYNLSKIGHWFIGGILKHAEALCAVLSPNVNSYKRLISTGSASGHTWCPVYVTYGRNNRSNMVRISTMEGQWQKSGQRVEIRSADGCVNPYLGSAAVLAAGLEGIEKKIDPGENYEINLYEMPEVEQKRRGIRTLPRTLLQAVEAFEKDELMKEAFGDSLHKEFCNVKYAEWWDYHRTVSEWEINKYIKVYDF